MRKRVFTGGFHHESDTFNPIITGPDDILVTRGEELLRRGGKSSINGIVDTLLDAGYEVIPGLFARAVPNGEWEKDYFMRLMEEFTQALERALPVDAVCLSLHGSMRVKDVGEAEGYLLEKIRALSPDVPVITTLDMHATVTERMMDNADAFVGYKCAPHTDTYETGIHAAGITKRVIEEGISPHMAAVHLPFLIAGEQSETSVEPMKSLTQLLREYEKKPHVMAASYLLGFPWADVSENGVTALVVTDDGEESARKEALELGRIFWKRRSEFCFYNRTMEVKDALDWTVKTISEGEWPVVLSDSGDNPTAGSSGDVTNFLKAIIADGRLTSLDPPLLYQAFYDPAFSSLAAAAGEGGRVKGNLGASFDRKTSTPLSFYGIVKAVRRNWEGAGGADLTLVSGCGIEIVVTSKHVGCYDPGMMRALGVEPEKRRAIVVKLGYLEPEIRAIARSSVMVLTDGSTNEIFSRLPYRNITRPVYPLDPGTECRFEYIGRKRSEE